MSYLYIYIFIKRDKAFNIHIYNCFHKTLITLVGVKIFPLKILVVSKRHNDAVFEYVNKFVPSRTIFRGGSGL